jgi:trehalose synthase-fused probable maltokinase
MSDRLEPVAGQLQAFLRSQRWFGSRTRAIRDVRAVDVLDVGGGPMPMGLAQIAVAFEDGGCERYVMLLASRAETAAWPEIGLLSQSVTPIEASADATALAALVGTLGSAAEQRTRRGGQVVRHDSTDETATRLASLAVTRGACTPLGVEQSNTSIRIGRDFVFKLIRRPEDGENLELEFGRFLTRQSFRGAPSLRAAWTWIGVDGRASTLGLLQDWVENAGDGWHYVRQQLAASGGTASQHVVDELRTLGATTALLHVTLGSDPTDPAFRPEPLTKTEVEVWQTAFTAGVERVCGLLAGLSDVSDDTRALAHTVLEHAGRLRQWRAPFLDTPVETTFNTIRIHGDYHLGQTLKTRDGFVIIDFEGQPARPLAERRRRHAAMRDVAGMLRSFEYAVETIDLDGLTDAADAPLVAMRDAFLDAYVDKANAANARFLPADRSAFDAWVSFFELEKALYEIEYELNHRPEWARIPLRGVLRLIAS